MFCGFVMEDYRRSLIPDSYLERIRQTLATLRRGGMKAVVRFSYSFSENDRPWDVPWSLTSQHIDQLRPLLRENADVIALLEAGFVGVWGEWYYTENYNFEPHSAAEYQPRRTVLDALLEAMPKERFVAVRYPDAKLRTLGITYADSITRATAYDGSVRSRIAFHNDGFLATSDDYGTFQNKQDARRYWMAETNYVPMGGETAKLSSFCNTDNAAKQMANYHWSYINRDYHPDVISQWQAEGLYDTMQRRVGYRLVLTEGRFTAEARAGEPFSMNLTIRNVGWAAPFNPRDVEVVWQHVQRPRLRYVLKVDRDPRFWSAGTDCFLSLRMVPPADMPEGDYRICLRLADPMPSLNARPEYSIRMANDDVWDETTGLNTLRTVHVLSATGSASPYGSPLKLTAPSVTLWSGCTDSVSLSSRALADAQVGDTLQYVLTAAQTAPAQNILAAQTQRVVSIPIDGVLLTTLMSHGLSWTAPKGESILAVNLIEPDHRHASIVPTLIDERSVSPVYDLQGRSVTSDMMPAFIPSILVINGQKRFVH